jgi:hypothetical protein
MVAEDTPPTGTLTTIETVSGPNHWVARFTAQGKHLCYWCRPHFYPPMPEFHTLCARCGQFLFTPGYNDPRNMAMVVCEKCDHEMSEGEDA